MKRYFTLLLLSLVFITPVYADVFFSEADNLWETMSDNFTLPEATDQPRVEHIIRWYAKHPNFLYHVTDKARPYLYYVYHQVAERDMPAEIALLPILESGYDPFAYSGAGAAGLWQLMPGTASGYGIKQNWWYDGRRDIIASTRSALDYLSYLNTVFHGDWLLSIAAYDAGEGTVLNAIHWNAKHHRPTDFWDLNLPKETQSYVPRLLAIADIISHYGDDHDALPQINNTPYFETVILKTQISLAKAATLAGLSLDDIYHLNPGYNRWATDPNGPYRLLLPIDSVDKFAAALKSIPNKDRVTWDRHHVKKGDSLSVIAKKSHTTVDLIQQVNQKKNDSIRENETLLIPRDTTHLNHTVTRAQKPYFKRKHPHAGPKQINHIVAEGESLWKIAKKYGVKITQVQFWNQLKRHERVHPGDALVIWHKRPRVKKTPPTVTHYTIVAGDSLWTIAVHHHTSVKKIKAWNHIGDRDIVHPGDVLVIKRKS